MCSQDYWICYFFFQAEDGIRDYKVTGVQTCALPIYLLAHRRRERLALLGGLDQWRHTWNRRDHPSDRVGHDRVHGDVVLCALHRPGAGERGDAGLRGRVIGLPEVAALP